MGVLSGKKFRSLKRDSIHLSNGFVPVVGEGHGPARKIQIFKTTRRYFYYTQNGRKVAQNDQRLILGFRLFKSVTFSLHSNDRRPGWKTSIPNGAEISNFVSYYSILII